jgi:membrane-associated phospholipid phosphatase
MHRHEFQSLLIRSVLALLLCAGLVACCYWWVDRPVAFYVHREKFADIYWLKWLTYPPPVVQTWSPLALVILMVRRAWGPLSAAERTLFVACLSLIVADEFRESGNGLFGRYWPETWIDNNPSLIGSGAYGFHPFHSGVDDGSFPSGHATRILGFMTVYWLGMPRGRAFYVMVSVPMLISMIGMNYHFVGDVIAGSFLGGIVGTYAAALGGIGRDKADSFLL